MKAEAISRLFDLVLILALLVPNFILVRESFTEYLDSKTYFSHSKESLTSEDIPSVTVCFKANRKLQYGEDLSILTNFAYADQTIKTLEVGYNQIHKEVKVYLRVLTVSPRISHLTTDCFSMEVGYTKDFFETLLTNELNTVIWWDLFFDIASVSSKSQ